MNTINHGSGSHIHKPDHLRLDNPLQAVQTTAALALVAEVLVS